jgi:acyl carrier protein
MDDTLTIIAGLIRDLFDEYDGPVPRSLTARDVSQWDSLANVQLIVLLERTFGIRFTTEQIGTFKDVGDLVDAIDEKRRGPG